MRKLGIWMILSLLFSTSVGAVEYLSLQRTDDQDLDMLIARIGRIEMGENSLSLIGKDGAVLATQPYSQVRTITFVDKEYTPVESVAMEAEWPVVLPIRIFTLSGQLLLESYQTDVPLETLPSGVYILQSGLHVEKILNR